MAASSTVLSRLMTVAKVAIPAASAAYHTYHGFESYKKGDAKGMASHGVGAVTGGAGTMIGLAGGGPMSASAIRFFSAQAAGNMPYVAHHLSSTRRDSTG